VLQGVFNSLLATVVVSVYRETAKPVYYDTKYH
jgi:hypothetical protein